MTEAVLQANPRGTRHASPRSPGRPQSGDRSAFTRSSRKSPQPGPRPLARASHDTSRFTHQGHSRVGSCEPTTLLLLGTRPFRGPSFRPPNRGVRRYQGAGRNLAEPRSAYTEPGRPASAIAPEEQDPRDYAISIGTRPLGGRADDRVRGRALTRRPPGRRLFRRQSSRLPTATPEDECDRPQHARVPRGGGHSLPSSRCLWRGQRRSAGHVASMLLQLLSTGGLSVAAGLRRDQEWVEWSRHARR